MTTTQLVMETVGSNGDRYWERPFDVKESIERIQQLEGRGTEFKVKSGLELCRAKSNLGHSSWYHYLYKAGIEPSKAQRRMKVAREFMQWANVTDIVQAIELAHSKSCILQDFASSRKVNPDEFIQRNYYPANLSPPEHILGVSLSSLKTVLNKVDIIIQRDCLSWTPEQCEEAKDYLDMFANQFLSRKSYIEEVVLMRKEVKSEPNEHS